MTHPLPQHDTPRISMHTTRSACKPGSLDTFPHTLNPSHHLHQPLQLLQHCLRVGSLCCAVGKAAGGQCSISGMGGGEVRGEAKFLLATDHSSHNLHAWCCVVCTFQCPSCVHHVSVRCVSSATNVHTQSVVFCFLCVAVCYCARTQLLLVTDSSAHNLHVWCCVHIPVSIMRVFSASKCILSVLFAFVCCCVLLRSCKASLCD